MRTRVAIALGSNRGDRRAHLTFAVTRLATILDGLRVSSFHETEPVGVPDVQPAFLNAAVVGDVSITAHALLHALLAIETARGRERPYPMAPRTLDLDLVLFGDLVAAEPGLEVPHPRFRERRFVLDPLAEVGEALVDPVTGATVGEILRALTSGMALPPRGGSGPRR